MIPVKSALRTSVLLTGFAFLHLARSEPLHLVLEQVQVVFRHGERTPRAPEMYPNDPYNASAYDPIGLGQLTNEGKMTEYRVGQMLRKYYGDFLGDIYRPEDVLAVSSDVDRTKMSLMLTLTGLFPPSPSQTWNANLSWMPVPIHYAPEKLDFLLKPQLNPVYLEALRKLRNSEEIRKKVSVFGDFLAFLSEKTGIDAIKTSQAYEVYNLLAAQKSMNLTLPKWCTAEVYKQMQDIALFEYEIRSYTNQLKRLNGGMLVRKFLRNMNLTGECSSTRKIHLYSGHEVNIAAFAKAHNFLEPKLPGYGSAIILEKLRDSKDGNVFIRMLHWTAETETLLPYKFKDCDFNLICPINKYLQMVHDVVPSEEELNEVWSRVTMDYVRKHFDENL